MRTSADRWMALMVMLEKLEQVMECSCRLDVRQAQLAPYRLRREDTPTADTAFYCCQRIDTLGARIQREVNRLTVERLDADLARKKRLAAA